MDQYSIPFVGVINESDIPVPLSIDLDNKGIITLSPTGAPVVTNKNHNNKLIWVANYSNGSSLIEHNEAGEPVSSEKIDHKLLREFKLIDQKGRTVVSQEILPGQCFFYRRRTVLQTGKDVVEIIHIFGWRIPNKIEEWTTHAVFLFESDMHVELGSFQCFDLDESSTGWKYCPNWRDIDKIAAE